MLSNRFYTVLALFFWMIPVLQWAVPEELEQKLSKLQYTWQDEEMPIELLTLNLKQSKQRQITLQQAEEDVEQLFCLFSHGYSGYGFFSEHGRWEEAKGKILAELETRSAWSVAKLSTLLRTHLKFIRDCHVKIGKQSYGGHRDFWYDTTLEVRKDGEQYFCTVNGVSCMLTRINGKNPVDFLFPSLNRSGEPVYRIGMLAWSSPEAVNVELADKSGPFNLKITLRRSRFDHYSQRIFKQDKVGGIPVLRIRSFSDGYSESLKRWVETAEDLKSVFCVIVDVRGNRGGNERWPIEWIHRLSGERVGWPFIFSELKSRTTLAGRANAMKYWSARSPNNAYLRNEAKQHTHALMKFEETGEEPHWTEPVFPHNTVIPNRTIIIVITNGLVGSAGEGFVMRVSRLENVVIVGENTRGAITFGNISLHRLPHSGLDVWLPVNFGLFPDGVFREEEGVTPDYWVPAADALNFAVAAVRKGTIAAARPLPQEWKNQPFVPEDSRHLRRRAFIACLFSVLGCILLFTMRRRKAWPVLPGAIWLAIGIAWVLLGSMKGKDLMADVGIGFIVFGLVLLIGVVCGWIIHSNVFSRERNPG